MAPTKAIVVNGNGVMFMVMRQSFPESGYCLGDQCFRLSSGCILCTDNQRVINFPLYYDSLFVFSYVILIFMNQQ